MKTKPRFWNTTQTGAKWGISRGRVYLLCRAGRVPGASNETGDWLIPVGTKKPRPGKAGRPKANGDAAEVLLTGD